VRFVRHLCKCLVINHKETFVIMEYSISDILGVSSKSLYTDGKCEKGLEI